MAERSEYDAAMRQVTEYRRLQEVQRPGLQDDAELVLARGAEYQRLQDAVERLENRALNAKVMGRGWEEVERDAKALVEAFRAFHARSDAGAPQGGAALRG